MTTTKGLEVDALARHLKSRLDLAHGPIWAARDAAGFVRELFVDETVVTSAESPKVWQGNVRNTECVADLMKAISKVEVNILWTYPLGAAGACQFILYRCTLFGADDTPKFAKALYVWTRTDAGWRVVADHYSFMGMDPLS